MSLLEACLLLCPLIYEFERFLQPPFSCPTLFLRHAGNTGPERKAGPITVPPKCGSPPPGAVPTARWECRWTAERQEQLALAERFGSARSEKPCQRPPSSGERFRHFSCRRTIRDVFYCQSDDKQQPPL